MQTSPLGQGGIIRFNQLLPPFDNLKMRQALLYAVDQHEYMAALAGETKYWRTCYSYFSCAGTMASEAGVLVVIGPPGLGQGRRAILVGRAQGVLVRLFVSS